MKIFFDGKVKPAISRLIYAWSKMGHIVVSEPSKADVQFSSVRFKQLSRLPKVLRLDGVYYNKAAAFNKPNSKIRDSYRGADGVIFQSETSKLFCEKYLGKWHGIFDIIYNGIDPSRWYTPLEHKGINIVSCSNWRRWKRLPEIVDIFNRFSVNHPNSTLHILGEMRTGAKEIKGDRIKYYGTTSLADMKSIYALCDIYLHLAKNDSCPSTVVEAIASGIPVVTTDACGGATEMCRMSRKCFVVTGEEISFEPDFTYKDEWNMMSSTVKDRILMQLETIVHWPTKLRSELSQELHIDNVAKKYIKVMERVLCKDGK